MLAIQYEGVGTVALAEVPVPTISPGMALIRVSAAGICQTDVHFRANKEAALPLGTVLGHEIAGRVITVAGQIGDVEVGQQVVVHPVWSCRRCRQCLAGQENACQNTSGRLLSPPCPGVSADGGLAEFVAAPTSALLAADDLDPAFAAVLTDAGLVPYHSINAVRDLLRPGAAVLVIGVGGLGQLAVSILRAVSACRIIAVDVRAEALAAVRDSVDHSFLASDPDIANALLGCAGAYGPDVVLDFVGSTETMRLAGAVVAPYGAIRVPGQSGGSFSFETVRSTHAIPRGATINRPYSGTYQDLADLIQLARTGRLEINIKRYALENAVQAFDDLAAGKIVGRAVVVMGTGGASGDQEAGK
jgi:alcohol dehydrogenase, propanol-preferring